LNSFRDPTGNTERAIGPKGQRSLFVPVESVGYNSVTDGNLQAVQKN
jgi:hypothetical protein